MNYLLDHFTSASIGLSQPGVVVCDLVLVVFLAICAYTDGTSGKIYNKVTFPAMLAGLLLHIVFGGVSGGVSGALTALGWSAAGLAVGMAIQWVPWMLGLAKAGDIKLLMAVGALKGWAFCSFGFLYGAAAFGIISLPKLIRSGEMRAVGQNIRSYVQVAVVTAQAPDAPAPVTTKRYVPWGVGLSTGFFIALLLEIIYNKPFWFTW